MKSIESKREREKRTVAFMIALYCKKNHKEAEKGSDVSNEAVQYGKYRTGLCEECAALFDYAMLRSNKCPFMETKTFCSNCKVHCYKTEMREKIRAVMRFSGPRMMLYHPVMAIRHVVESKKEKHRLEKEKKL